MISHLRKSGCSHGSLHERNAQSTSDVPALEFFAQRAGVERVARALDLGDAHVLDEEVRRDEHQPAHAMILHRTGIDRRDRSAVAVAEQEAALKADCVEHARQHRAGFLVHERDRARHRSGFRRAVAGARIDEHAGAGGLSDGVGKTSPQADGAKAFVQHDDGRRGVGARADHAVFEPQRIEIEKAGVGERGVGESLGRHGRYLPSSKAVTIRESWAKLCSMASPEVSISASARE